MDEYIKREDAIRALCEAVHDKDGIVPCRNQVVSCQHTGTRTQEYAEKILAVPAADVKPVVRGRWVHPVPGDGEPYCSVCHSEAEYFLGYGTFEPDFCPNCGADMREGGGG